MNDGLLMKIYPSDEKMMFLIADDFRQEVGDKLTILGLFPGGGINVEQNLTSATLHSLALIFIFQDGYGLFLTKATITDPDGKVLHELDYGQISKSKGSNMVIGVRLAPFQAA